MAEIESRALPPGLSDYITTFSDGVRPRDANRSRISIDYYEHVQGNSNRNAVAPFAQIEADPARIDTALEWLYASYYHIAVRDIRPDGAEAILPASNPRLADLTIGAETFREVQIARFLGNTDALGRYNGGIKFITDRGRVTLAEIEQHYRNGIRGFIAGIVSEEFNKVSFLLNNAVTNPVRDHGAVLTRNPQNGYLTLSYGGAYTNNEIREIKDMPTIDALLAEMGRRRTDFDQTGINQVRAQAALIPAVAYSASVLNDVVNKITAFYLDPNQSTFRALGVQYRTFLLNDGDKGRTAARQFYRTIYAINPELAGIIE